MRTLTPWLWSCLFLVAALALARETVSQNPLQGERPAAPTPFAGRLIGEDLELELSADAKGNYTGVLVHQGQRYPAEGRVRGEAMVGKFRVGEAAFDFRVLQSGGAFELHSDGAVHALRAATPPVPADGDGARGGVGIAFVQGKDGQWRIAELAPGGPAARAKVTVGAVLHAVDRRPVAELDRDAIRKLVTGPIGSAVTLTIETEDEVQDVILQRAALGNGAASGTAPAANPPVAPKAARNPEAGLPPFLHAGTRVAYFSGSKTMPGATAQFVPDDNGGLTINGRNHRLEELEGSAGAGYTTYDVVHASAAGVALQQGSWVYADASLQTVTRAATMPVVGDAQAVGEIWIHPARLAAMREENTPTLRVRRVRYPLDGREYDAITTQLQGSEGYWRNTYDMATGLLLVHTSCAVGKSILAQVGANMAGQGAGSTTVATMRFLGMREMALPWAGQGMPHWLRAGERLRYRGEATNSLGQGIVAPWPHLAEFAIEQSNGGFAVGRLSTQTDYGTGTPSQTQGPAVFGAGQTTPIFIDPAVLQGLRAQQVLDQDALLRRQVGVLAIERGLVTVREQGPIDAIDTTYDVRSGMAVQIAVTQQQGPATIVHRVQLEQNR